VGVWYVMPIDSRKYLDVIQRDGEMCVQCGAPGAEIDHIIPRSRFGRKRKKEQDELSNLQLLCLPCHRSKHMGGRTFLGGE
jgi:5-methylcytosine-specific restriction endonuclease McrA